MGFGDLLGMRRCAPGDADLITRIRFRLAYWRRGARSTPAGGPPRPAPPRCDVIRELAVKSGRCRGGRAYAGRGRRGAWRGRAWRGAGRGDRAVPQPAPFSESDIIVITGIGARAVRCGVTRLLRLRAHCDSAAAGGDDAAAWRGVAVCASAPTSAYPHRVPPLGARCGAGERGGKNVETNLENAKANNKGRGCGAARPRAQALAAVEQGSGSVPGASHSPAIAQASGSHARQPSCGTTLRVDP